MMKTQCQRVRDAISVRQQLQKLGCTLSDASREKITHFSNNFVKNGGNHCFKLAISDEARVIVHLYEKEDQQSGVVLEYI